VLAVAPTPFFGDYGCHVRIVEEVEALCSHGVQTSIVTYPFGRDLPGLTIHRAHRLPGQRRVDPGSSLHKFSMDAALVVRALRAAKDERPALIHGHLHEGALIGGMAARARRIPWVFDFQGSLTSEMVDHGFIAARRPAYRFFRRVEAWIVDQAPVIITSTRHGADVLMREFACPASRITVVPDAVNTQRFRPLWEIAAEDGHLARSEQLRATLGIPTGRPVIVYLGLLAEYQGITHLLRAAETLVSRGVDAHFLIMGYPGEDRYRALARWLGLGERVTFTGAIPYEQAPAYLALGDVAVAPKISQTEGNGKLLNYIAMGLPTVAFDTAVSREILGDLGIYAPPGDWTALATELDHTLRDSDAAQQRGRALRTRAIAEHSWDQSAELLLDVYARSLGARSRGEKR
jgi:glycosyltransferase involved in cell wall biosynthesis